MYARIKSHPSAATLFGEKLVREGVVTREELEAVWAAKKAEMQSEQKGDGTPFVTIARRAPVEPGPVDASAMWGRLRTVLRALGTLPEGLEIHPKLVPFVKKRAELLDGKGEVDWATGESLAWGTLLLEGVPVRLSGQDSGRGTFSQRHAVLHDVRTQKEHVPLNAIAPAGVRFEVYDSLLSETAVMGFEFGYSVAEHRTLVLWEAQFGDFMNGAQVIIDQFLAGSETKWGQPSGLVLLLPHGHEGQGPEHSSARIERFLTLAAEENLRIAYPSTPASYFHLLRLQGREPVEKPLVVFTPKSLLRNPRCVSPLAALAEGRFEPVIDDRAADPARTRRVVLCTGKVYFDLLKAREDAKRDDVALVRVERLYPFPAAELQAVLARYPGMAEVVWCQEEPRNMGAWRFVRERFLDGDVATGGRAPRFAGRPASAAPAPGSLKVHLLEQDALVRDALGA
jgi:2-oxoglutarate dehydrogenase E1 component